MSTSAAATIDGQSESESNPAEDLALLLRLSHVRVELHRYRQEAAGASAHVRQRQARVSLVGAIFHADAVALATVRKVVAPDRVTVDVLREAVAGGRRDYDSASRRAARSTGAIRALLARLSAAIAQLEEEADGLRAQASPLARRVLEVLERKGTLPLVASLDGRACGECHLSVPTALASAVATRPAVQRCPHCNRVLVARDRMS